MDRSNVPSWDRFCAEIAAAVPAAFPQTIMQASVGDSLPVEPEPQNPAALGTGVLGRSWQVMWRGEPVDTCPPHGWTRGF